MAKEVLLVSFSLVDIELRDMTRMQELKIGRNDLCPCGSGKKFKKCHLRIAPTIGQDNRLEPCQIPEEVWEHFQKHAAQVQRQVQRRQERYGQVRPIISVDHQGYKFVAVGNELHYAKTWRTFPDFLMAYIRSVLGSNWGNSELAKPFEERHQIFKWYDGVCRFQSEQKKGDDGLYGAIPNGIMAAYVHLAYDLYILRHHQALQAQVVNRLKHSDQFQGARYELFVAAVCIRAGFDIEYEDESDKTQKHPEFIATHKETGQKISVEAKSRHRAGVLGHPGKKNDSEARAGIGQLLNKALQKPTMHPYVIFIDINLPPSTGKPHEKRWFQELMRNVDRVGGKTESDPDPFNLILFTNYPYHYGEDRGPAPAKETIFILSQRPQFVPQNPEALLAIIGAEEKYGNIPNDFSENEQ